MRQLYAITGPLGAGKSTVLGILKEKGYVVLKEQVRMVEEEVLKHKWVHKK